MSLRRLPSRPALPLRLTAWLSLVILVAGGCRRAPEATEANATEQPAAGASRLNSEYPRSDFVVTQAGRPGGVLRVSTAADVGTFDIHAVSHGNIQWLGRFLFDCLVYRDQFGEAQPWLARSWTVSPDGLVYTFHLREDVTFSDGTPFDADAVRINFEHMLDPATRSPLAGRYISPYVRGRVLDRFTFEATLSKPYPSFLDVLAQSWLGMISPRQIQTDPRSIKEWPIGSGPFILTEYRVGERAVFRRRDDYGWSPPYQGHTGPAYLEGILLEFVPEPLVRLGALQSGQHVFTYDAPPQNAAALRLDGNYVVSSRVRQGNPQRAISFNVSRFPFDDVAVRRALALATDREAITRLVGFGEFIPKADFLAANTKYYDPAFAHVLDYDLAAAEKLLVDAGWTARDPDGIRRRDGRRLEAEIHVAESATPSAIIVALQSDYRKIGFDLRIVQVPATTLTDLRRDNRYQAFGGGYWHTNTPDGLYVLYHSDQIFSATRVGQNSSRIADPTLDAVLHEARHAADPSVRRDRFREAQRLLTELVPAVPLHESQTLVAYRRELRGVLVDTSHSTALLTAAWWDESDGK